jgi:hypothetical protein
MQSILTPRSICDLGSRLLLMCSRHCLPTSKEHGKMIEWLDEGMVIISMRGPHNLGEWVATINHSSMWRICARTSASRTLKSSGVAAA